MLHSASWLHILKLAVQLYSLLQPEGKAKVGHVCCLHSAFVLASAMLLHSAWDDRAGGPALRPAAARGQGQGGLFGGCTLYFVAHCMLLRSS